MSDPSIQRGPSKEVPCIGYDATTKHAYVPLEAVSVQQDPNTGQWYGVLNVNATVSPAANQRVNAQANDFLTGAIVDLLTLLARHTDTFGTSIAISAATTFSGTPTVAQLVTNSYATLPNGSYQDTFIAQIDVASAFVGTISFYGLEPDGSKLQLINAHQRNSSTTSNNTAINTSSVLNQVWEGSIAAFKAIYVVCTAFTSGAASVSLGMSAANYAHAILNTVSVLSPDSSNTGTVTNDNDVVAITLPGGQATALVQITGNNVGTLLFEVTPDGGTNWYPIKLNQIGTDTFATQATATGVWRGNISGFTNFHVKLHPTTSGTATVLLRLTQGVQDMAVRNATTLGQNVMVNSAPVVLPSDQTVAMNLKQIGGNTLNAAISDGVNQANILEITQGLYNSGGPVDSTGKPQQLSIDRIRSLQGKVPTSGTITSTVAGDSAIACASGVLKTVMPGNIIFLYTGGTLNEVVVVSESYVPASNVTSIPLKTNVVVSGSTTAKWSTFAPIGPAGANMLPDGLLPAVMVIESGNATGNFSTAATAGTDGLAVGRVLEVAGGLYNGTTEDRARGNLDNISLLASASRTTTQNISDQTNYNGRGLIIVLDMTNVAAGPSVTLTIQGKDPVSGKSYTLLAGAAVTTVSTNVYYIYPGASETANVSTSKPLPRTWNAIVTANNANAGTYSVGASVIV